MTLYLCEKFSGWCNVAILSRGYGRKGKRSYARVPDVRLLDERAALFFGDEPVMLARRAPNASVHVGPSRYSSGLNALAGTAVDLFVLDDGFQHIELHRDLDIVVLDGEDDPRSLSPLPAGPLREPVEAIGRADIVVINHCDADGKHAIDMYWLRSQCPTAPIVLSNYKFDDYVELKSQVHLEQEEIEPHPLFAFCGIGKPDVFLKQLKGQRLNVVGHRFFADHHVFTGRELKQIEQDAIAVGAAGLITTEKDAMRIETSRIRGLPIYTLSVSLNILQGEEAMWERIGEVLHVG